MNTERSVHVQRLSAALAVALLVFACTSSKPGAYSSDPPAATLPVTAPAPTDSGTREEGSVTVRDGAIEGASDASAHADADTGAPSCSNAGIACASDSACCSGSCGGPDPFNYVFGTCS